MILVLEPSTTETQKKDICLRLQKQGFYTRLVDQTGRVFISVDGIALDKLAKEVADWNGVSEIIEGEYPYYLASREFSRKNSTIKIGKVDDVTVEFGGEKIVSIAGPCAIETEDMAVKLALKVKEAGTQIFRAMLFKPRSSPYSFQGLGKLGISILKTLKKESGLLLLSEVREPMEIEQLYDHVDMFQVGTRNMSNFQLLKYLGKARKPVLLKRGMGASFDELLCAAEYIMVHGNSDVILCERGIRTFDKYTRFSLDIAAVPALKELSHLPVIVDPSHATGRSSLIAPMIYAAISAGADGVMTEIHENPETAFSDGPQAITPEKFKSIMKVASKLAETINRKF